MRVVMGDEELEFKLTAPEPGVLDRVLADAAIQAAARGELLDRSFAATYWDTPDFTLLRHRLAFRQREGDGHWRVGLKGGGGMVHGLARRQEWEQVLTHPVRRWDDLPPGPLRERILPLVNGASVPRPLFTTVVNRRALLLEGGEWGAELALDYGRVEAAAGSRELCEVELEWRHGPLAPLEALAAGLCQRHGLTPARGSKFTLGLELLGMTTSL